MLLLARRRPRRAQIWCPRSMLTLLLIFEAGQDWTGRRRLQSRWSHRSGAAFHGRGPAVVKVHGERTWFNSATPCLALGSDHGRRMREVGMRELDIGAGIACNGKTVNDTVPLGSRSFTYVKGSGPSEVRSTPNLHPLGRGVGNGEGEPDAEVRFAYRTEAENVPPHPRKRRTFVCMSGSKYNVYLRDFCAMSSVHTS